MRLEGIKNLLLSDTLLPDVFISEYMMGLSSSAIKSYLYILMAFKNQKSVTEKDLAARICVSVDEVKGALAELALSGVIEWSDKGMLTLVDLKEIEIKGYVRIQSEKSSLPTISPISPENEQRDNLARSIEKTFFHGSMAYKWYRQLDILLDEFAFEPQVVYKLFQICADRKQLGVVTQLQSLANVWKSKGISTMEQLSAYLAYEDEIAQTMRKIARRLRRSMTGFDEEYIRIWIEKLQYPYEVIDFAIRKMCEYQNPTMNKADAHLRAWFAANLKTLPEVKLYEEEKAKANKLAYQQAKTQPSAGNFAKKQNFAGVEYEDSVLENLTIDPEEYLERLRRDQEKPS